MEVATGWRQTKRAAACCNSIQSRADASRKAFPNNTLYAFTSKEALYKATTCREGCYFVTALAHSFISRHRTPLPQPPCCPLHHPAARPPLYALLLDLPKRAPTKKHMSTHAASALTTSPNCSNASESAVC
eukprot:5991163-Pleurochrysis_carterae.AAC.1